MNPGLDACCVLVNALVSTFPPQNLIPLVDEFPLILPVITYGLFKAFGMPVGTGAVYFVVNITSFPDPDLSVHLSTSVVVTLPAVFKNVDASDPSSQRTLAKLPAVLIGAGIAA